MAARARWYALKPLNACGAGGTSGSDAAGALVGGAVDSGSRTSWFLWLGTSGLEANKRAK
jgi:hypothetical protein